MSVDVRSVSLGGRWMPVDVRSVPLGGRWMPVDVRTVSNGASCVPLGLNWMSLPRTRMPQGRPSAARISTCVPQVRPSAARITTCVPQGEPSVPFGATREGSRFVVRACRSKHGASGRDLRAATRDLRCAPRFDCVSRRDFRAAPHSQRPRRAVRTAQSPRLACLSFERMRRSARLATRKWRFAPRWAVLAAFSAVLLTTKSIRAARN